MKLLALPRLALAAVLLLPTGWTLFSGDPAVALPLCRAAAQAPTHAPTSAPDLSGHDVCRARPTSIQPVRQARPMPKSLAPADTSGHYQHLGATTMSGWAGVMGRISVADPGVRKDTLDFTAARFMARQETADGDTAWLEAGWAETGWAGGGRQRIYTYDTNRNAWTFFDDYAIKPGDRIWIYLQAESATEQGDTTWLAWLWWGDQWHLLASQNLPISAAATIEQYVEIYSASNAPKSYTVPPVSFDNVQLLPTPGAPTQFWREDDVTSTANQGSAPYCVTWLTRFDTWNAGDCIS
ncbi:hypothetical protein [Hamadaea tsunoensis]|uniref:hypothetical protein n=1 Tax=Hamadaea tsunoensis TaxID=53368 RepID=UPI000402B8FD|nr:hypothetical protein [Hamadaea tsunoensis]